MKVLIVDDEKLIRDVIKEYCIGNKCSSVDCLTSYDVIEKWLSVSTNTYFINSDELSNNVTLLLNKIST